MMRVLIINDFINRGGADVVYRASIDILASIPGVEVETFDETDLKSSDAFRLRIWNFASARQLRQVIERFRPHRVWVHNYHNNLSPSILPVIAGQRHRYGFRTYLTCHDYQLVFYNPAMVYFIGSKMVPVPVGDLGTIRAFVKRSSDKGLLHDMSKKLHWHLVNHFIDPQSVFDVIFCPSPFIQRVLLNRSIDKGIYLLNPISNEIQPTALRQFCGDTVKLAFVGRIAREKGIEGFVDLTESIGFPGIESITIFGEGDQRPLLEKKYHWLIRQGKVVFAGKLPHQQLFRILRNYDALVLSSTWYENAPLVIVEAAALGMPVLVHNIGSLIDFADEVGNKILYYNDPTGLAAALDRLLIHLREYGGPYNLAPFAAERYRQNLREIMKL